MTKALTVVNVYKQSIRCSRIKFPFENICVLTPLHYSALDQHAGRLTTWVNLTHDNCLENLLIKSPSANATETKTICRKCRCLPFIKWPFLCRPKTCECLFTRKTCNITTYPKSNSSLSVALNGIWSCLEISRDRKSICQKLVMYVFLVTNYLKIEWIFLDWKILRTRSRIKLE